MGIILSNKKRQIIIDGRILSKLKKILTKHTGLLELYVALFSWIPTSIGKKIRYIAYKPLFKKAGKFFIDTRVTIWGFRGIELGNNVNIMKNSYIYAHDDGFLKIGDNFSMNTNVQIGAAQGAIIIGNDCSIGPNTVLRAANHTYKRTDIPINKQGHTYGEIIIEDDVWIASNCVITSNSIIRKGSVISAGSVVKGEIGEYSIVSGIPAKLIRKRK